ncbi:MAG TPA: hypothetical protein VGV59_02065 [Pyrinomonadaceae bacterium]|nr:hypothetical protein [Pyrinomonadaceae bacterium]
MPKGKFALTIVILLLVFAPLIGERLAKRRLPADLLASAGEFYECPNATRCHADFNGDGVAGYAAIVTLDRTVNSHNSAVLVVDGDQELLWQPFYHAPDAPPTRLGVRYVGEHARLLVYDGITGLSTAVFALERSFGRDRMAWATPSEEDRKAFNLMSAYDTELISAAGRADKESLSDFTVLKLALYYLTLCAIAAVWLYRKSLRMSAAIPLNPSGNNP